MCFISKCALERASRGSYERLRLGNTLGPATARLRGFPGAGRHLVGSLITSTPPLQPLLLGGGELGEEPLVGHQVAVHHVLLHAAGGHNLRQRRRVRQARQLQQPAADHTGGREWTIRASEEEEEEGDLPDRGGRQGTRPELLGSWEDRPPAA
eukprot:1187725-Prorocentrum_minimum.AAC.1